jgi:hypothetical protein
MHDDQLTRLLRQIDEPADPDSAFADRLFNDLSKQVGRRRGSGTMMMLVAAVMLVALLAVGAAVGSGLIKVPWFTVEVSPAPSSVAIASESSTPSATASATPTSSVAPSTAPTAPPPPPPTSSSALFDLLPAQQPAGFQSMISCSGSIGTSDPVALVRMHGADGEVLRDYADPASPRTICTFGIFQNVRVTALIDARHVIIEDAGAGTGYTYAVVDLPDVRYHWFQLPGNRQTFIAVGPGLDQVLWMTADIATNTDKIHVTTHAGDAVIAVLPDRHEGICGSPEASSARGAYTHSGADLFVLDQPPDPSFNSLLVAAGHTTLLSVLPPAAGWKSGAQPTTALWSPLSETLFYRQGKDVWTWSPGSNPKLFLAGVQWLHPTITPDGVHLAYSAVRPDGSLGVYLVDLAHGGRPQLIGKGGRNNPVFLNSTQLWYQTDAPRGCTGNGPQPLVYSLVDGSESPSIIDYVLGAWPSTSSNY